MKKLLILATLNLMGCGKICTQKDNIIIHFYAVYDSADAGKKNQPAMVEYNIIVKSVDKDELDKMLKNVHDRVGMDMFEVKYEILSHE